VEPERCRDSRRQNGCPRLLEVIFGKNHSLVRERIASQHLSILPEAGASVLREHLPQKSSRTKSKRAALDPACRTGRLGLHGP